MIIKNGGWHLLCTRALSEGLNVNPTQAIERIPEAKGLLCDEDCEIQRPYEIFHKNRNDKL